MAMGESSNQIQTGQQTVWNETVTMLGNPPGFGFRLVADSQTHLSKKDLMGEEEWVEEGGRQTILV